LVESTPRFGRFHNAFMLLQGRLSEANHWSFSPPPAAC
jgi:hypothetical protein